MYLFGPIHMHLILLISPIAYPRTCMSNFVCVARQAPTPNAQYWYLNACSWCCLARLKGKSRTATVIAQCIPKYNVLPSIVF
jgi:hypothetical protein